MHPRVRIQTRSGGAAKLVFAVIAFFVATAAAQPSAGETDEPGEISEMNEQLRCLALSLYWEARSEGREGMIAVGSVVLNRVASEEFPATVCAVVYEGGETPPCQFSWWCDGKSDVPRDDEMWKVALDVANELLTDPPIDPTQGGLFFHSTGIEMPWRVARTRTVEILGHVYYR